MGPFLIFSCFLDGFRFLFSQFSMVAVSYIFHIFFRKAQVHLNNKKILIFLLITTLLLSDLNEFFCELSAFWHLFGYFNHFLVVNKKTVSYFEKFNGLLFLMIEEFDGSFLIRVFLIERECVYKHWLPCLPEYDF